MMSNAFYGWFDDATQIVPTCQPPLNAPCLFCGKGIHDGDVRTHGLMHREGYARRSYFYRTHRTCANLFGNLSMDGFIFDMIKRNGD